MTPQKLRQLCPAALHGAYLNAAASSPLPTPVERAATAHFEELREHGDIRFGRWVAFKEELRGRFARFINATPAEIAFLPSTSMGFNIAGHVLRQLKVREVVTFAQEFPSTTVPLLYQGLSLSVVKPRKDGRYELADVERAIGRRTGAIAVSSVQFASGFRADLEALGRLCRDRGLYFIVNGAQALGQVPIDVSSLGIDLLCGTSHKWLMASHGTGLFFARKQLLEETRLPFAGWLSTEQPMAMETLPGSKVRAARGGLIAKEVSVRKDAASLELGAGAFAPLYALGAALELLESTGIEQILANNLKLQASLRQRLGTLGFRPNAPNEPAMGSGICVFPVQGDPKAVASALAKRNVWVSARGVGLRISTHVFNDEEDLEKLISALKALRIQPG